MERRVSNLETLIAILLILLEKRDAECAKTFRIMARLEGIRV